MYLQVACLRNPRTRPCHLARLASLDMPYCSNHDYKEMDQGIMQTDPGSILGIPHLEESMCLFNLVVLEARKFSGQSKAG